MRQYSAFFRTLAVTVLQELPLGGTDLPGAWLSGPQEQAGKKKGSFVST